MRSDSIEPTRIQSQIPKAQRFQMLSQCAKSSRFAFRTEPLDVSNLVKESKSLAPYKLEVGPMSVVQKRAFL